MRVLIAPDKFRGTLTAIQAAESMAAGWRRARPGDSLDLCPMADGGEGTMATLIGALSGRMVRSQVTGPLGDTVLARFGLARIGTVERVAIVESAEAAGLTLVPPDQRDIRRASTRGLGELISTALDWQPTRLLLCLGGTGTNDGGAGMALALGVRLLQDSGQPIDAGGEGLLGLATIDASGSDARMKPIRVDACADVDIPLTGPSGASALFGPQKGASPKDVQLLDTALRHLADIVRRDLAIDFEHAPGAGAGGGLGFGAMAFLGARITPGVELVTDALQIGERIRQTDLAITGEGRFDESSLRGKAPSAVLRLAREHGVRAVVICGEADINPDTRATGAMRIVSMVDRFGRGPAMGDAVRSLELIADELGQSISSDDETSR